MPAIKSMANIVEKWMRVSAASEASYTEGIQNPRKDWAQEAAKAEANYKAAVVKAAGEGRFGIGVKAAGTSKWQENALAKGPARWSQGINLSADAYSTGFAPYRQVIESIKLPDRKPRGDPGNINRVAVMAAALHEAKIRMRGGR